jgi:nitrite reductase/ring-hydroxylating ferredoxin subunit
LGFLKRLFGICETQPPADDECWTSADGKLEVVLDRVPELSVKGGAVRLEGPYLPKRLLVVHGEDGQYHAFPNRCTHMGNRRIDPVPEEDRIRCCSVGKSTFDYSGQRISGSAKEPLEPLTLEREGGKLIISVV